MTEAVDGGSSVMKELKDQIKRLNTEIVALKSFLLEKFFVVKKVAGRKTSFS